MAKSFQIGRRERLKNLENKVLAPDDQVIGVSSQMIDLEDILTNPQFHKR